jgi:hypothetical protein
MNECWFYTWREPSEFLRGRDAVSQTIKDRDHRTQANKWFREAWVLGLFAVATGATAVRLVKNDRPNGPDGEVTLGNKVLPVQIVEAFEKGRRPDAEYKTGKVKHLSEIREWDNELCLIPDTVRQRIRKKESRNYSKETILLVYLNMGNDPLHAERSHNRHTPDESLLPFMRSICDADSTTFDAICILWRHWLFGPERIVDKGQVCIPWQLLED